MQRLNSLLAKIYLVLIFLILYAPIVYLIVYSFNSGGTMNEFTGFTMEHYQNLFADKRLLSIVLDTLLVALLSAFVATVIGTAGAIYIYSVRRPKQREHLMSGNNLLMVMPDVIIGASFLILFTYILPVPLGFWSVLLSHIAFNIPIVVLMVLPRLYAMNPSMLLAAEDLGASFGQILDRVILPNISSGILTGFFMALTYSLDDFAVTFFVTGGGFTTLAVEVYSRARRGVSLEINALSTLMFLLSLVLVVLYYSIQMRDARSNKGGRSHA